MMNTEDYLSAYKDGETFEVFILTDKSVHIFNAEKKEIAVYENIDKAKEDYTVF